MWLFMKSVVSWAAAKKVDELASTIAVRQAVLRELVRLQFDLYVAHRKLGEDRAMGLRQMVIDELLKGVDLSAIDPESEEMRHAVTRHVALKAVALEKWVQLHELSKQ